MGVSSLWGFMGAPMRILSMLAEFEGRSLAQDNPHFLSG